MNLIEKIVDYYNNNDINIFDNVVFEDVSDFNTIIYEILNWMKLQHKRNLWILEGKKDYRKPMHISLNTSWGKLFIDLILKNEEFKNYFSVEDDNVFFSSDISEEEVNKLCKFVFDNYNPTKYI